MKKVWILLAILLGGCAGESTLLNEVRTVYGSYAPDQWTVHLYTLHYNWSPSPSFDKVSPGPPSVADERP